MPQHSTTNSSTSPGWIAGYRAAREGLALIERPARGRLVVAGRDRRSYLQGLFTNDIEALTAGQGCYSAYLTPQGRMITDLHVYELGDVMLLTMGADVVPTVVAKLEQFVFSEDVQIGDVTDAYTGIVLAGPQARRGLAHVVGPVPDLGDADDLPGHGNRRASFRGDVAIVLRTDDSGAAGYEVVVPAPSGDALRAAALEAGAVPVSAEASDALRIEAGVPLFHRDMDEETIPLEAGIEAGAISQTKGCYVGQEVIVRVLHRGHGRVAKKLVGIVCAGPALPSGGTPVTADARPVGHVTSATFSPALGSPIALAYVHRDFTAPGTRVGVEHGEGVVAALPFVA